MNAKIEAYKQCLQQLPAVNHATLKRLVLHLCRSVLLYTTFDHCVKKFCKSTFIPLLTMPSVAGAWLGLSVADMSVSVCLSVCLSVTEVHWCIIANLGFKFRSQFTTHCGRGACGREGRDHRREEWRDHLALC